MNWSGEVLQFVQFKKDIRDPHVQGATAYLITAIRNRKIFIVVQHMKLYYMCLCIHIYKKNLSIKNSACKYVYNYSPMLHMISIILEMDLVTEYNY